MAGNNSIKQYFRWLPAHLGLFNKGAFLHQIDNILNDDIFLVSFPKSGNTWLRFIIANLISDEEISFENIDQYVPDLYISHKIVNSKKERRILKSHNTYFRYYPKTIYIYRDYRDVLVSYYLYQSALNKFKGTIQEFITSDALNKPFKSWKNHITSALNYQKTCPENILLISYEELSLNPEKIVNKLINFCEIKPINTVNEALLKSDFDYLKTIENKKQGNFKKLTGNSFFREGKVGNWQKHLSDSDIDFLKKDIELVNLMQQLGYSFS
ncbi:MAG: sulfotransferase domain-containing protein [Vicingaceae bacterium]|nr:sulfotransferase domain-containing protein [Vicingaceae bacterium]